MDRKDFIKTSLLGFAAMTSLNSFKKFSSDLSEDGQTMPLLFVGHGSPMNAIEDNEFSSRWKKMGKEIPRPKAVLCISAHWYTRGTQITAMPNPPTIHDFGGFPQELFNVQYSAPGNPELAKSAAAQVKKTNVGLDHEWGLDHGTWSITKQMYPDAKIPVLQLSIDYTQNAQWHFELAKELAPLRRKGVLIMGSGNMVHNLGMIDWSKPNSGYDWAIEANEKFKGLISKEDFASLINYDALGKAVKYSIPSPDHYLPLLYALGLKEKDEKISFFNDQTLMGSLSMTSVKIDKA